MRSFVLLLALTSQCVVAFRKRRDKTGKEGAVEPGKAYAECGKTSWPDAPTITLLSGTGEGKSTISDVLARDPWMAEVAEDTKAESETSESCIYKAHWFFPYDRSEPLSIIDTPGFGDTRSDMIEKNHVNIVSTLRATRRVNVLIWALNSKKNKVDESRQQAFKFVRAYFGRRMYKHLIFVYTRFEWRKAASAPWAPEETGETRVKFLTDRHKNIIEGLIREVESEFWPDETATAEREEAEQFLRDAPFFGINTFVMHQPQDNFLSDGDMGGGDYNADYPDGCWGVYDPEKSFSPNSASQLLELKATIKQIWQKEEPVNTENLRRYDKFCKEAATKLDSELNSTQFGANIVDCLMGQLWKLFLEDVLPRIRDLPDGRLKAIMGIKANLPNLGSGGQDIYDQAYEWIDRYSPFDEVDREAMSAFYTFENYTACNKIPTAESHYAQAVALFDCLVGIRPGQDPRLVKLRVINGYLDNIRPGVAQQIEANVKALPRWMRDGILASPHMKSFEELTKNPQAEQLANLNDLIGNLKDQMERNREASEKEKKDWQNQLDEMERRKNAELEELRKEMEKTAAPSPPSGGGGKR